MLAQYLDVTFLHKVFPAMTTPLSGLTASVTQGLILVECIFSCAHASAFA